MILVVSATSNPSASKLAGAHSRRFSCLGCRGLARAAALRAALHRFMKPFLPGGSRLRIVEQRHGSVAHSDDYNSGESVPPSMSRKAAVALAVNAVSASRYSFSFMIPSFHSTLHSSTDHTLSGSSLAIAATIRYRDSALPTSRPASSDCSNHVHIRCTP